MVHPSATTAGSVRLLITTASEPLYLKKKILHHGDVFITTASESFYVLSHEYVFIQFGHSGRKRCMKT